MTTELTLENIRSGAFPSDAHAVGFLLGELEKLQKREGQLMEFLRSFISGGVNQDFKPWARELYRKLYSTHEPNSCTSPVQCPIEYTGVSGAYVQCKLPEGHQGCHDFMPQPPPSRTSE